MPSSSRRATSGTPTSCTCQVSRSRTSLTCTARDTKHSVRTRWSSVEGTPRWTRRSTCTAAVRKVTLVHFREGLDPNVKPWVLPDITNRFKDGSIAAHWSARVTRIEVDAVLLEGPAGPERLHADHVYLMTGFTPDTTLLQQLGVTIDPNTGIPAHDRSTMETDVERVFIAGVLASGNDANKVFIENGRGHGTLIARRLVAPRVVAGKQ